MGSSKYRLMGLGALLAGAVVVFFVVGQSGDSQDESSPTTQHQAANAPQSSTSGSSAATTLATEAEATEPGTGTTEPYDGTPSPVTAEFTHSVSGGSAPLVVEFEATAATSSGGDIEEYQWVFGDGLEGSEPEMRHVYQASGTYRVRLIVTDSEGFESALSSHVLVTGDGSGFELVDYSLDPGFENSTDGFISPYGDATMELSGDQAIEGSKSLVARLSGWSDVILPVIYPWEEGPSGTSLTASALIRVDTATEGTVAQLCAVAYWNLEEEETRSEECTDIPGSDVGPQIIEATLGLDPGERLGRIYLYLSYPQDGEATITIDDVHLILSKVPG